MSNLSHIDFYLFIVSWYSQNYGNHYLLHLFMYKQNKDIPPEPFHKVCVSNNAIHRHKTRQIFAYCTNYRTHLRRLDVKPVCIRFWNNLPISLKSTVPTL